MVHKNSGEKYTLYYLCNLVPKRQTEMVYNITLFQLILILISACRVSCLQENDAQQKPFATPQ